MELMIPRELPAGIQQEIVSPGDDESNWENTPQIDFAVDVGVFE